MKYPGNAALAPDLQQRLLDTFAQSRELAMGGKRQEAILGCEFVLQLDPEFAPARELLEELRSSGALNLADDSVWAEQPAAEEAIPDYGIGDRFLADEGEVSMAGLASEEAIGSEISFADFDAIEEPAGGIAAAAPG